MRQGIQPKNTVEYFLLTIRILYPVQKPDVRNIDGNPNCCAHKALRQTGLHFFTAFHQHNKRSES